MMLTWEAAYYDNHEQHYPLDDKCSKETLVDYSHDHLGLAVAKLSYHVYMLGEGIVGQVAVTGKHEWMFAEKQTLCSSFLYYDWWETQFSAGIKTVLVVDVIPHGVVQLGSLTKVTEDLKLVAHIRRVFSLLHGLSHIPSHTECNMKSALNVGSSFSHPNLSARNLTTEIFGDNPSNIERTLDKKRHHLWLPAFPALEIISQHGELEPAKSECSGSASLVQSRNPTVENKKQEQMKQVNGRKCEGETSKWMDVSVSLKDNNPSSYHPLPEDCNVQNNLEFPTEISGITAMNETLTFAAGCELYEALGPAFQKQKKDHDWEDKMDEVLTNIEMPMGTDSCFLTSDSNSENLLEAVVASVCQSGSDIRSENSTRKSVESSLDSEQRPKCCNKSKHNSTTCSESYSVERSSLTIPNTCGERVDRLLEPAKTNKKRARSGENARPRPRDRQLIQDRIRELRELVPNGSKCSIDSLLERTIKHMLFLQGISKHSEKLNSCNQSKLRTKKTSILGCSSYEQGSSWAVEVGSHLKVCSIVVENLTIKGQMLVEMLCDECGYFLEIAEAIRSLGLTILKGITEDCGDKTWMCFVVEGQNDRIMHRMDLLWSLVQIMQGKTTS